MNNDVTLTGGENPLLAGRYQVVRQLGTGGMGSVWLAEDRLLDDKLFAVKMLPSVLVSNKRAYRQLKAEALVAMKLVHPNIVQIRVFEENNGNPFLVMDYVEGQTLDDYLAEKGELTEAETVRLLKPIAAALDYAHGEGVVHRDVKPANIMIRKDGHPYILDFGIAREIQETMTRVTGKLSSGTLLYMSPEQLRGQPPKAAQDVYSFAAMAYECLKGEPPFSRGQIEYQILNEQPEPLPTASALTSIVLKGLSKSSDDRPEFCALFFESCCVNSPSVTGMEVSQDGLKHSNGRKVALSEIESAAMRHQGATQTTKCVKAAIAEVQEKMRYVASFRGEKYKCFARRISQLDSIFEEISNINASAGSDSEVAIAPQRVSEISSFITSELEWLKANWAARSSALSEDAEIRDNFISKLAGYALTGHSLELFDKGKSLFYSARNDQADGRFIAAKEKLQRSKECLTQAITFSELSQEKKRTIDTETHSENDTSSKPHVVFPALKVISKIGEREVQGAAMKIGPRIYETPYTFGCLTRDSNLGSFVVEYVENGLKYEGVFKGVKVNWTGLKEVVINLSRCLQVHQSKELTAEVVSDSKKVKTEKCRIPW